jgi:HEAT repeat protein
MRAKTIYCVIIWLSAFLPACRGAFDEVIDSPMYADPDPPAAPLEWVFPEEAKGLWLKALARPEADLQVRAAEAIALAHRRGVKGLDTMVAPLVEALERPEQHPAVRLAVAQALVTLGAREAAPALFRQAQAGGGDLRDLVEPALAEWDYRPARAAWLARLGEPATPRRSLVLAIQGLAAVREEKAAEPLREMVLSNQVAVPVRLEAARALGSLRSEGLEPDAERLAADASPRGLVTRLAAASLLHRHKNEAAVRLLRRLAEDAEPTVAALAVARLLEIDPGLVVPLLERLLADADARLRSLAVEVLRRRPTEKHIHVLADRLNDPDPEVRTRARQSLNEIAADKRFRAQVIDQATQVLAGQDWRGLEQAAVLLTQLDHKPAASRLVELLTSDRQEVAITAAWGLRRLAVADTLPAVLRHVETQQRRLRALAADPRNATALFDHQLSQLNQFLGRQKYAPAEPVLREFIPRMEPPLQAPVGSECRAAAIWALGLIDEGKADPALTAALEGRLNDISSLPPEEDRVRRMSAIALGRLGAMAALPSLRKHYQSQEPSLEPVNNACGWAIARLTGEAVPAPKPVRKMQRDWFLTPDR